MGNGRNMALFGTFYLCLSPWQLASSYPAIFRCCMQAASWLWLPGQGGWSRQSCGPQVKSRYRMRELNHVGIVPYELSIVGK